MVRLLRMGGGGTASHGRGHAAGAQSSAAPEFASPADYMDMLQDGVLDFDLGYDARASLVQLLLPTHVAALKHIAAFGGWLRQVGGLWTVVGRVG